MRSRFSWLAVFVTFLVAAVFEVMMLSELLRPYRPEFMVLVLVYWLLRYPEKIGMTCTVISGLMMDVISGSALGVHVLVYAIICYLILNMHQRLKMFPIVQQSVVMFLLVATQLMLVSLLNTLLTSSGTDLSYLWVALSSAILWPFVLLASDRLSLALR
jgi:rod shape-determining protein MreD